MKANWKKIQRQHAKLQEIIDKCAANATTDSGNSRIQDFTIHAGYAEPGYDQDPNKMIVLGNFNTISKWDEATHKSIDIDPAPGFCADLLEKAGAELEWSDEWVACNDPTCGKLVRTSPNSYGWKPAYWNNDDGQIICHKCALANRKSRLAYLKSFEGNDSNAVSLEVDIEAHGYVCIADDLENGLYGGQSADPKVIGKSLRSMGISRYLFSLDSVGQFDMDFSVWVHKSEVKKLVKDKLETNSDIDPATAMQKALSSATVQMGTLQGDGIKVAKCHNDGTATVKMVSPQDFIDGKALD